MVMGQVKIYPAPAGQPLSPDYTVEVNGKPVPVYPVITQHHDKKYSMAYEGKVNLVRLTPMSQLVGTRPIEVPKPNDIEIGTGRRGVGSTGYGEFVTVPTDGPYIHNVVFKNIYINGTPKDPGGTVIQGISKEKNVSGIVFNNFVRYGEVLTATSPGVKIGNFADNIQFVKGQ